MFKKSKKFVITGLVAGAMIAGGSFAAADYYFGTKDAQTSALKTTIAALSENLTKVTNAVGSLTGELTNAKKKHVEDMDKAQTAVAKANGQVDAANKAIDDANKALTDSTTGVSATANAASTAASTAAATDGTNATTTDADGNTVKVWQDVNTDSTKAVAQPAASSTSGN